MFVLFVQLGSVLPDLNAILDDHWMGGGSAKGHGLVLTMHLLNEKQSFSKLVHLFTDQYSMLLNGINCLAHFHQVFSKVWFAAIILHLLCSHEHVHVVATSST